MDSRVAADPGSVPPKTSRTCAARSNLINGNQRHQAVWLALSGQHCSTDPPLYSGTIGPTAERSLLAWYLPLRLEFGAPTRDHLGFASAAQKIRRPLHAHMHSSALVQRSRLTRLDPPRRIVSRHDFHTNNDHRNSVLHTHDAARSPIGSLVTSCSLKLGSGRQCSTTRLSRRTTHRVRVLCQNSYQGLHRCAFGSVPASAMGTHQ